VRPAPKTKQWIGVNIVANNIAASTNVLIGVLSAGALLLRPFTILRSRFVIEWASDQVVASEFPSGALGFTIVSDEALAAGIASIPKPMANADSDWFVHQGMITSFAFGSGVGFVGSTFGREYTIDSKAMRKVGPNDSLAGVVENLTAFGADITAVGRMLIQLH